MHILKPKKESLLFDFLLEDFHLNLGHGLAKTAGPFLGRGFDRAAGLGRFGLAFSRVGGLGITRFIVLIAFGHGVFSFV